MEKYFTKEGLAKLKKEIEHLKTVERKEIADRLKHSASFGDLTDNAAYQEAKESQFFLEARILELENLIRNAKIIEKGDNSEKVEIGSLVLVNCNGSEQKLQIVGAGEVDPSNGKISFESPVGEMLLKKSVGEEVEIETPGGKVKYKIIKIG